MSRFLWFTVYNAVPIDRLYSERCHGRMWRI